MSDFYNPKLRSTGIVFLFREFKPENQGKIIPGERANEVTYCLAIPKVSNFDQSKEKKFPKNMGPFHTL